MRTMMLKRMLELIPTLLGVMLLSFLLLKITPGDPARLYAGPEASAEDVERIREDMGLNKPLHEQFWHFTIGVFSGQTESITVRGTSVRERIFSRLPATIELAVASMFFAVLTAVIVGVLSAAKPNSWFDNTSRIFIFIFLAMPSFWLGLELIILLSRKMQWFPPAGRGEGSLYSHISHLALPAITLGVSTGAVLCRILRSSMLEVMHADFIRTARAKGTDEFTVIMRHAFRNALIPFVTLTGLSLGALLGGAVIVEQVFNWPGVGKLIIDSIRERDLPVTMGCVMVLAIIFVLMNAVVDMLYVVIDPRIGGDSRDSA